MADVAVDQVVDRETVAAQIVLPPTAKNNVWKFAFRANRAIEKPGDLVNFKIEKRPGWTLIIDY